MNDKAHKLSPELEKMMVESPALKDALGQKAPEKPKQLQFRVGINRAGEVVLQFDQTVSWIAFDPPTALKTARQMIQRANAVLKQKKH